MATGILAVLDDVAMLLNDVAVISKVAAKKTAGLLGDDLAVNAEKATGFHASRELPVIWAITKGSMLNKLIILPCAFLLNAYLPWMLTPILIVGGSYLSYEGAEHVIHWLLHRKQEQSAPSETSKIKSAIRTDFILSIEIVVITLGTVIGESIAIQLIVVSFIALLATVGVYGVVALLVRMDDMGLYLLERSVKSRNVGKGILRFMGRGLIILLPKIIRLLSVVGTIAMLLVGGGILIHYIEPIHHLVASVPSLIADLLVGFALGSLILSVMNLFKKSMTYAQKLR